MGNILAKNCGCNNNENNENKNFVELNSYNKVKTIPNYYTMIEPPKLSMQVIESYNHNNNFFSFLNKLIFLQNYVKEFIKKKKEKQMNIQLVCNNEDKMNFSQHFEKEKPFEMRKEKNMREKIQLRNKNNDSFGISYTNSIKSHENEELDVSIKFKSPNKFYGTIKNEQKEGLGIATWEDGSKFKGLFNHNKAEGFGIYTDAQGTKFLGHYENNQPNGWGIYQHHKGSLFEGYWGGIKQNGIGYEIWPDGSYYQGDYRDSRKYGLGTYKWPDGTLFEGEWEQNSIMGYGIIFFNDRRIYSGQLKSGKMHGYGEFFWPDGKKYFGFYTDDQKNGFGMFLWNASPLKIYIGGWVNGKQNGIGILIQGNKTKYGLWCEGKIKCFFEGIWEMKKNAKSKNLTIYKILLKEVAEILSIFL